MSPEDLVKIFKRFWSVAELQNVTEIEIKHFIPEDNEDLKKEDLLEAYDIKLKVPADFNYELDLPPHLAKQLYEKLGVFFRK